MIDDHVASSIRYFCNLVLFSCNLPYSLIKFLSTLMEFRSKYIISRFFHVQPITVFP
ncbi:hypothetical protein GLOIN_2v1655599 [Rhizophagus irregularis DAOM 181602=DAOM 197198]|uniref:Uncharacterized protein n=1 Tax=Rhizophagus irregularis (strain DAOM 181602 / DAOM 197198 / MUCL 43194) TaxID=747089 RepID=A0A2P4PMK2_RHIID|nr:hypothetical protein GLOIN_2v1655599 [Rhizophagus irregularis DAOM 181602=DAOM 197198]POG66602.1 hypothetical protein GLOIN_2v1655599 [Rhizophagus irregularis DAOM 181602=DAOM 197198]|eukprot:XP_025173468.1 hypothetical protein GLOIN_2v1655599 [Rhizophagus irregularis DAOM 181602=DAOM 197198]